MNKQALLNAVQAELPELLALYAFGSRVRGEASGESDLDLAVLLPGRSTPMRLFDLAQTLADVAGCSVDLIDFRAASTVMQHQIITTGERWWQKNSEAALFEAAVLSEKLELDSARAGLLSDIQHTGSVHGR